MSVCFRDIRDTPPPQRSFRYWMIFFCQREKCFGFVEWFSWGPYLRENGGKNPWDQGPFDNENPIYTLCSGIYWEYKPF